MAQIRSFKDLKVWQLARQIRHKIYKITSTFPLEDKYNLVAQMRSAGVSMTSNIAEGFGRFFYRENQRACRVSRGEAFASGSGYPSSASFPSRIVFLCRQMAASTGLCVTTIAVNTLC